jgi:hypothetical protein
MQFVRVVMSDERAVQNMQVFCASVQTHFCYCCLISKSSMIKPCFPNTKLYPMGI